MAVSSEKCILWKTHMPFKDTRQSHYFSIMGRQWYLRMRSYGNYYDVYLRRKIFWTLGNDASFKVSTYIKHNDDLLFPRTTVVFKPNAEINDFLITDLSSKLPNVFKPAGELVTVCVIIHLPASEVSCENKRSDLTTSDIPLNYFYDPGPSSSQEPSETHSDSCTHADLESLSLDLGNLLSNERCPPDVVVRCGDRDTPAHRLVLAARSEVFATMFRNKMTERETGQVEIVDMDVEDFELLLKFIYTGKIKFPSENSVMRLFSASDKYDIPSLKKACADQMISSLSPVNCLRFLELSEDHCDKDLQGTVIKFVAGNLNSLQREDWSSFNAKCPNLTIKVYNARLAPTLSQQVSCKKVKLEV